MIERDARAQLERMLIEAWAFVVIGVIAFVGGLVAGGLVGSTKTETVYVATSSNAAEEAEAAEAEEGTGGAATRGSLQRSRRPGLREQRLRQLSHLQGGQLDWNTGPDLNEYLAPDDDKAGIEEMIVDPNAEIAEGYSANVMPTNYGQSISEGELQQLVQFLIKNSPAGGAKPEVPGGEENDVGGPTN